MNAQERLQLLVVIVSWNTCDLLRRCLVSLKPQLSGIDAAVYVVDNASHDGSANMVQNEFPWVRLIANKDNRGFAKANNQVLRQQQADYVLLLNPDAEVTPGAIDTLITFLEENSKAGVVAPQLLNSDGSIQRSCREFPTFTNMAYELLGLSKVFPDQPRFRAYKMLDFTHQEERQVDQPEGACLLIRNEVLQQVGTLDEGYFMLFEEVDWCYRVKQQGWQIWFTPRARVVHHYGQSIKQVKARMILSSHKGMHRFWKKHYMGAAGVLDVPVYAGLMSFAYARIVAQWLKGKNNTMPGRIVPSDSNTRKAEDQLTAAGKR